MRVLEVDPSISYKMGKNRKHRIRKARENAAGDASSDEAQAAGCPHINKAVNLSVMRKTISRPSVSLGECTVCCKEGTKTTTRDLFGNVNESPAALGDGDECEMEPSICVCLQCGHQGCDRNSLNKHALKHYKTPHSAVHSIIVNLTTWSTWCYLCDEEVQINTKVQNCIDLLQKQLGLGHPEPVSPLVKPTDSPPTDCASSSMNNASFKSSPSVSCAKVKGLSNLGNTCFFNAVMQSMCQTRGLESLLVERSKHDKPITIFGPECGLDSDSGSSDSEREEESGEKLKMLPTIQTVYGDPGPITLTLLSFLQEMKGGTSRNGTVNPSALFTQVCKKAPRFKGFQQQDSHELLRYLVDCIRTEEIRRGQTSILKFFKLSENINPKKVDDETKTKIKEYGKQVKHTFLDVIFGGQLVSTVKCEECTNVSQIYESFLDLSLPVTEEKPQRPNFSLLGKKKDFAAGAAADAHEDGGLAADVGAMGLEGCRDRPSKYQDKKGRKLAKKDAKRRARLQKTKSMERNETAGQLDNEDKDGENGSDDDDDGRRKVGEENDDSGDGAVAKPGNVAGGGGGGSEDERAGSKEVAGEAEDSLRSTRSSLGAMNGSAQEGSKDSLCDNQDDEKSTDDPSDADVEDNVEGDSLQHHKVISASPLDEGRGRSCQASDSSPLPPQVAHNGTGMAEDAADTSNLRQPAESSGSPSELCKKDATLEHEDISSSSSNETGVKKLIADVNKLVISTTATGVETTMSPNNDGDQPDTKVDSTCDAVLKDDGGARLPPSSSLPTGGMDEKTRQQDWVNVNSSHQNVSSQQPGKSIVDGSCASITVAPNNKDDSTTRDTTLKTTTAEDKLCDGQNVLKTKQKHLKEAKQQAMSTLAPRYHPYPKECSVLSCLNQFTAAELLTGSNKVVCKECTRHKGKNAMSHKGLSAEKKGGKDKVYSNANKQYLIFKPPCVLTLHLKRFEQTGLMSRKVNRHVDFPLVLDLAPYCSALASGVKDGQSKVLYSLYAIVEHSGRLSGGHYTAYIKVRPGMGSHTQFLHAHPPAVADVLNIYYERILKTARAREGAASSGVTADAPWSSMPCAGGSPLEAVDHDLESRAESLSPPGRWFHISDSRVNEVSETMVLKAQAYLLFYERIF